MAGALHPARFGGSAECRVLDFERPETFPGALAGVGQVFLQTAYLADIRDHSQIRVASGRGRTSFIDTRDIASVADLVMSDPAPHAGQAYTLTGAEALDYYQVVSLLSAELGRPVTYAPLTLLAYRRELRRQKLPAAYVSVQLLISLVARAGLAAKVTGTVERLLGRSPTPLATYIHDQRSCWASPGR